ncbi:MAG TPA: FIST N-terminal domain-containing protein [Phycisphaerae bacterium]|nr:FIST N-terminal domain-containing protein [Phycisphaerae bacterium]
MRMISAIACEFDPDKLIADLTSQITTGMEATPIDLLLVFVSIPLQKHFVQIISELKQKTGARLIMGSTAESVLGGELEIERQAGVSAMAMSIPGVTVDHFHFADEEWPEILGETKTMRNRLEAGLDLRLFIMMGDPFTTPVVQLLDMCSQEFPNAPVVGGMASGIDRPGETRLAVNDDIFSSGLIGVSFAGPLNVDCVVSQGCRPIGPVYDITAGHDNVIEQLNHKPAMSMVRDMMGHISAQERRLVEQRGLQIGRVIDSRKDTFGRGDFLVRNILGIHRPTGSLSIGDMVHSGQIIQFHVQDAETADEDLKLLLQGELLLTERPRGALMFSCNGRGTNLFGAAHHDIQLVRESLGPIPVAGFFCAGELGPVGGRNFIHGQTVSLALFH